MSGLQVFENIKMVLDVWKKYSIPLLVFQYFLKQNFF